ncbi:hypothetical protein [Myxococcus sp. AB025B]|uniref:hypothetical protein n=1 Tax=Myxococcus sp. AB025B TaxID=2562794 RepID=UPI00114305CF|nr:hypothetical protein [Myxococcus sp. AB025B]
MLEQVEQYRPHVIAALTDAGSKGRTVKEQCGALGAGEQAIRRCLAALVVTGEVLERSLSTRVRQRVREMTAQPPVSWRAVRGC